MPTTVQYTRAIAASPQTVFKTVATPEVFAQAIPHVLRVEFRSEITSGVGTRFWEVRSLNGRQISTALEVTDYQPDTSVRIVSDAGGTLWDSLFEVSPDQDGTILTLTMAAQPHNLIARMTLPLIMRMVNRNLATDMDHLKSYCESVG